MERKIISISDNGAVTVPSEVRMSIDEIANLLGIFHQTAKRHIRAIEKSGVADGDYSMTCTVEGLTVYPEYYGLDMVMAVAFRVESANAKVFRRLISRRATQSSTHTVVTLMKTNTELN